MDVSAWVGDDAAGDARLGEVDAPRVGPAAGYFLVLVEYALGRRCLLDGLKNFRVSDYTPIGAARALKYSIFIGRNSISLLLVNAKLGLS